MGYYWNNKLVQKFDIGPKDVEDTPIRCKVRRFRILNVLLNLIKNANQNSSKSSDLFSTVIHTAVSI